MKLKRFSSVFLATSILLSATLSFAGGAEAAKLSEKPKDAHTTYWELVDEFGNSSYWSQEGPGAEEEMLKELERIEKAIEDMGTNKRPEIIAPEPKPEPKPEKPSGDKESPIVKPDPKPEKPSGDKDKPVVKPDPKPEKPVVKPDPKPEKPSGDKDKPAVKPEVKPDPKPSKPAVKPEVKPEKPVVKPEVKPGEKPSTSKPSKDSNAAQKDYVAEIAPSIKKFAAENDLYASVMIAQSILATNYGKTKLADQGINNIYAIKGIYDNRYTMYKASGAKKAEKFRKYRNLEEANKDYLDHMKTKPNYKKAFRSVAGSHNKAIDSLATTYAKDKQYAAKIKAIIKKHDLTKYDAK